ncbi:STM4014 family protein [Nocardia yamanashiensis]|uniref:STM4014 family protein n=1 Tax=Nocardia yamanashiensis TaxID=209247 RepID=UPI001E28EFA3|nr:STM4014 family protein [Nocardia yamanashiensis]UGT41621.1 STM4014 family protein [Nocardia yamanashiensis]
MAIVGIPENRRVTLFQAALGRVGLPAARVVSWREVLTGSAGFRSGELVRLDSPGEDPQVEWMLRAVEDPTRVEGSARWYRRFVAAARTVADAAAASGATLLDDPADLAVLFDKRLCHAVLRNADVAVPFSPTSGNVEPVRDWQDVRERMAAGGLTRAFVKLAHGSSASGVLAVETASRGRVQATTSVQRDGQGRLFNSLRVRRYTTEAEVAAIVDALAPDGLHIERWLPKASQDGRSADLRVVVVAGRATHAVVRTSPSPLTNLHLGGARGDLAAARTAIDNAGGDWSKVLELCERAAACFPRFSRVGVDLLPGVGWRRFAIGEVNAFGDLLPGLRGLDGSGAESGDTYDAQVTALTSGRMRPSAAVPAASPRSPSWPAPAMLPPTATRPGVESARPATGNEPYART